MKIGEMAIPVEWLEQVGFDADTEVELVPDEKKLVIQKKVGQDKGESDFRKKLDKWTGCLNGQPEDIDQFIEDIRGR